MKHIQYNYNDAELLRDRFTELREDTIHRLCQWLEDNNAVVDAMTYGGLDKKGVLVTNQTVVNGSEGIKPYLTNFHKNCLERIIVLDTGQKLAIEDVEVNALPADNPFDPSAIGFKFYTPEFVLGYSSDTSYSKALIKAYQGCDASLTY